MKNFKMFAVVALPIFSFVAATICYVGAATAQETETSNVPALETAPRTVEILEAPRAAKTAPKTTKSPVRAKTSTGHMVCVVRPLDQGTVGTFVTVCDFQK